MKNCMCTIKGLAIGMAVGATAGVAVTVFVKPKKKTVSKTVANCLDYLGNLMETIADYAR